MREETICIMGEKSERLPGKGRGESPWLFCCFTQTPLFVSALNLGSGSLGQLLSPCSGPGSRMLVGMLAFLPSSEALRAPISVTIEIMHQNCLTLGPQTNALPSESGAPLQGHYCGVLWCPWVFLHKPFSSRVPLCPNSPPLPRKATFSWSLPTLPYSGYPSTPPTPLV